ncbi:MAG: RluA family pseudouridine synthase [Planctomycetota bacterium]
MLPRFAGQPPKDLSRPLQRVEVRIDARQDGARLDVALHSFLTWRSRSSIHRLIRDGYVELSGRAARPASRVRAGEMVVVRVPHSPEPDASTSPDGFDIPILYEDRWMVVVDKPAGLAVHPAGRRVYGTLIHYLHCRYRRPDDPGHDVVPRLLHRLDRETSGVVAAGLDDDFHAVVGRQFEERQVEKTYLAVVHGRPRSDDGWIDASIGPARSSAIRLKLEARDDSSGLPALTHYRVRHAHGAYALVELTPKTGRTHQLRVHMAAIGCPLVGDKVYGVPDDVFFSYLTDSISDEQRRTLVLDRHALHAHRLRLWHPRREEELSLTAPLPADMAALVGLAADTEL